MNELTTLLTAIGDFFRTSDWYQMVKWPFWVLLFTVAAGGVYCARFGKKTLIIQSIVGTLSMTAIYLVLVILHILMPPLANLISELPFLSVNETSAALLNPFTLSPRDVCSLVLRLMILVAVVNVIDSFRSNGKTIISWLLMQAFCFCIALLGYKIITGGISLFFPQLLNRYAFIPVILIMLAGLGLFCCKIIFTVILSEGNPHFSTIYKFFTVKKAGSLFTVSSLSVLFFLVELSVLHATGSVTLNFATVNISGLWIILAMVLIALFFFSTCFLDRKKS